VYAAIDRGRRGDMAVVSDYSVVFYQRLAVDYAISAHDRASINDSTVHDYRPGAN
jgi:hypothetical protein